MPGEPRRLNAVFSAISDPTRREVMRHLADGGPGTATELAAQLPVSRQAVAKHLAALHGAGLVDGERHGREVRYRLTPGPLAEVLGWMEDVGGRWDDRLASLEQLVARRRDGR